MASMVNVDLVTLDEGEQLLLCHMQGQVILMALAVASYDGKSIIGEEVKWEVVAKCVGEIVGEGMNSPERLKQILQFYDDTYGVKNLADFKHVWKLNHQPTYKCLFERDSDRLEQLAFERRTAQYTKEQDRSITTRTLFAYVMVRELLPHVTYETLKSRQLCEMVHGSSIGITYDEYREIVQACILERPMGIGESLPSTGGGTRQEEVEQAFKLLNFPMYGPEPCWQIQRGLYYNDLARLAKFASFQTLASMDCYMYLGERFQYIGGAGVRRNIMHEMVQHVNVVGFVMDQMDPVDLGRVRKVLGDDFENAIVRKQEMIELRYRFGANFQRNVDEAVLQDTYAYQMECKYVLIFYEILKEVNKGGKNPNHVRVIRRLHKAGKLGSFYSVDIWVQLFKPGAVRTNVKEIDAVYKYIYAKNRPK